MSAMDKSREWLEMAQQDLRVAEYLLNMRPLPVEIICYHCEQAAEKMLKGALVSFQMIPPKTHDLLMLCRKCCEKDKRFEEMIDFCVELTPYGVQVRYPSDLELDEEDVTTALSAGRRICGFTEQLLTVTEEPAITISPSSP